mmetsp:Transcript_22197/g.37968  ORF Transcript_22197/g.37968 Transcript_22197/m.37968 type:complete len:233 (+) Transcript_22197:933-1631(+)
MKRTWHNIRTTPCAHGLTGSRWQQSSRCVRSPMPSHSPLLVSVGSPACVWCCSRVLTKGGSCSTPTMTAARAGSCKKVAKPLSVSTGRSCRDRCVWRVSSLASLKRRARSTTTAGLMGHRWAHGCPVNHRPPQVVGNSWKTETLNSWPSTQTMPAPTCPSLLTGVASSSNLRPLSSGRGGLRACMIASCSSVTHPRQRIGPWTGCSPDVVRISRQHNEVERCKVLLGRHWHL